MANSEPFSGGWRASGKGPKSTTSKDRLAANGMIVLMTLPVLYLIWYFKTHNLGPPSAGPTASNTLTP